MVVRGVAAVLLATGLLTGCSVQSHLMSPTGESATALRPAPRKALVMFVRPGSRGDDVQAVVYEGDQFIGVLSSGTVVAYQADPGPHRFMVISEAADFIDAELGQGRTYYIEVAARMGAWRARFSLLPLSASANAGKISGALSEASVVAVNDEGRAWSSKNHESVMKKKAAYEPKWLQKEARPLLRLEDGTPPASE